MSLQSLLVVAHVVANLVWVGSIAATALVLAGDAASASDRGKLALAVYARLAAPAFVVSFVAGLARLGLDPKLFFVQTHWMHGKLPLALGVIGLHHVIGARAKRMSKGESSDAGPAAKLGATLVVLAGLAAVLALLKPF